IQSARVPRYPILGPPAVVSGHEQLSEQHPKRAVDLRGSGGTHPPRRSLGHADVVKTARPPALTSLIKADCESPYRRATPRPRDAGQFATKRMQPPAVGPAWLHLRYAGQPRP